MPRSIVLDPPIGRSVKAKEAIKHVHISGIIARCLTGSVGKSCWHCRCCSGEIPRPIWTDLEHLIKLLLQSLVYVIAYTIYNLFFHPLRNFPGPLLARASLVRSYPLSGSEKEALK